MDLTRWESLIGIVTKTSCWSYFAEWMMNGYDNATCYNGNSTHDARIIIDALTNRKKSIMKCWSDDFDIYNDGLRNEVINVIKLAIANHFIDSVISGSVSSTIINAMFSKLNQCRKYDALGDEIKDIKIDGDAYVTNKVTFSFINGKPSVVKEGDDIFQYAKTLTYCEDTKYLDDYIQA